MNKEITKETESTKFNTALKTYEVFYEEGHSDIIAAFDIYGTVDRITGEPIAIMEVKFRDAIFQEPISKLHELQKKADALADNTPVGLYNEGKVSAYSDAIKIIKGED